MSDNTLAHQCAETLAGIKTGSLFSVKDESRKSIFATLSEWNKVLTKFGLRAIPLRYAERGALIYLYRESDLDQDLSEPYAQKILERQGYSMKGKNSLLMQLAERLKKRDSFPHEIGLFLGYPPEDVEGFMRDSSCGYKCVGCWKVYGDVEKAKQKFRKYKQCREYYADQITMGRPIGQLIVGDN